MAIYRSYRKLLNKWKKLPEKKRRSISPPSPPSLEDNKVVELHIDTYKLDRRYGFLTLTISKGNGIFPRFLVMEYEYARREIEGVKLGNSKMLVDGEDVYLLLTVRRNVEVMEHRNKLFIDINEDSIGCLLVDYGRRKATLFSIGHDIRRIRTSFLTMISRALHSLLLACIHLRENS